MFTFPPQQYGVSTTSVLSAFDTHDGDGNGELSAQETAQAYVALKDSTSSSEQMLASFFATLLVGGKDDTGLPPDFDGSNSLSKVEFEKLAAGDNDDANLTPEDFKAVFGENATSGGTMTDAEVTKLEAIADGTETFDWPTLTLSDPTVPITADEAAPIILQLLMMILVNQMRGQYNGGGYGNPYGGGGQGGYNPYQGGGLGGNFGGQQYGNPYDQFGGGFGQQQYNPYGGFGQQGFGQQQYNPYGGYGQQQQYNPYGATNNQMPAFFYQMNGMSGSQYAGF